VQPLLQWRSKKYYIFQSVFVALGIQHAMRMRHIVICGLSGSTAFFHILMNGTIFGKKKLLNKKCVFGFSLRDV
jgi:hypothetical protein